MQQNAFFETLAPTKLFFRCAIPNMVAMAVTALYMVADGIFVGLFVGQDALAAVNLVMPLVMISFALSDMIAVGSSVQIAIRLGQKQDREASSIFAFCSALIVAISCVVGVAGFFLAEPALRAMGADASVTALAAAYLKVYALFSPLIMIFFAVDNYLRICGKVRYSMVLNVGISLLNILLDFWFIVVLHRGVASAALASCLSLALGSMLGFLPFLTKKLPLRFVKPSISLRLLGNILANGFSEFFSSIAGSVMMLILNGVLLRLSGSLAVAAFSIVMYVDSVVGALLFGMADSMQPAISYCYGAGLRRRMFLLEKRVLAAGFCLSATALAGLLLWGGWVISLFVQADNPALLTMSLRAMELYSLSYLVGWIVTGLSSFFTALDRPALSLLLAASRTLLFPLLGLSILPRLLQLDGVWLTPALSGGLSAALALVFLLRVLRQEKAK
ncbi:MAG: MATE family efflux transporter [Oscillibacter sp.]